MVLENPYTTPIPEPEHPTRTTGGGKSDLEQILDMVDRIWPRVQQYLDAAQAVKGNKAPAAQLETSPVSHTEVRSIDAGNLLDKGIDALKTYIPGETTINELLPLIQQYKPMIIQQLYREING